VADQSFQERTERATPKRRDEARKKGQVARSRELPSVCVLLAGLAVLFVGGGYMAAGSLSLTRHFLGNAASLTLSPETVPAMAGFCVGQFLRILGPLLAVLAGVAAFVNLLQVGPLYAPQLLRPDFSRLSPAKGIKRILSAQAFVEFVKSIAKLGIVGWIAYTTVSAEYGKVVSLVDQGVGQILLYVGGIVVALLWKTGLALAAMAALDYLFQRWEFERNLRMTKQEVKEEFRQTEGDPHVKSRIRSIQREMARKRMMAEVPKADVVITNPTHLAVALSYRPKEMSAPVVVAKGAGRIAERIREIAQEADVPVVENKPLARSLFKGVEIGSAIPEALYQAVAEVLAFVYRLRGKKAGGRG